MLRKRIHLLFLLLPLGALWWWLCLHAPIPDWNGLSPSRDGKRFGLSHHRERWQDWTLFDIDRRHFESTNVPLAGLGGSYHISVIHSDKKQRKLRLDLFSQLEQRLVRSIEMSIPLDSFPRVVSERFVVHDNAHEILWMDLTDPTETWKSFPVPRGDGSWLLPHPRLPVFRRSASKPVPPGSTQPPQSYTELFRIDGQGKLSMLSSWSTSDSGNQALRSAWFQGDTIVSLDPSGAAIEVRSLDDGALLRSIELIPAVDLSKQKFCFDDGYFFVEDGRRYRYYCLAHEKWLVPPLDVDANSTRAAMSLSADSSTALWESRLDRAAVITDPVTDAQICKIQTPGERFAFLDPKTLISIDSWFALTIRRHDLRTGATLLTWRPFWWVLPVFLVAVLTSVVWVGSWLRMQRRGAIWAWVDMHILLSLLMVLIVIRLKVVGDPVDTSRMPYQHAIYVTSGFLFVAWAWLFFGFGSIISRLSHLLIVYAILLGGLAQVLAKDTHLAWMGVALVSIPSLLALPVFLTAWIRGWRWSSVDNEPGQEYAVANTELITLRQIMIVTAVFAVLSMAVRPLVPGLAGVLQLQWPIGQAAAVTASGLTALFLAIEKRSLLRRVGLGIAVGLVLLLVVDAISLATYAGWWKPIWWFHYETTTRHCLGFFCTVFIVTSVLFAKSGEKRGQRAMEPFAIPRDVNHVIN